jgi:hypothetical protein
VKSPFKDIISTKTAARLLEKTERQIRNMCADGKLTAQRLDPDDPFSPWMIYYPITKGSE